MAVERNTIELSQQEQEEVAKLFEEFASRDWQSQAEPEHDQADVLSKEAEDAPSEPAKKKLSRKQVLAICAAGITLLLAIGIAIALLAPKEEAIPPMTLSAGNHLVAAVTKDGTVLSPSAASSLGSYILTTQTEDVKHWKNIVSISVGTAHTLGLKSDGTVVSSGILKPDKAVESIIQYADALDQGQMNVGSWSGIAAVSAGYRHSVGLRKDGTVVAVGDNSYGQCEVEEWKDIIQISAGSNHTVGLKSDGTVVSTEIERDPLASYVADYGQSNVGTWTDIIYISAGPDTTIGVRKDGTVVAAGRNAQGQCNVATWTNVVSVAAGLYHTVGLKKDGTVVCTEIIYNPYLSFNPNYGQDNVSHMRDIVAVAVTNQQTFGLKKDGTVIYAGLNSAEMNETKNWKNIQLP